MTTKQQNGTGEADEATLRNYWHQVNLNATYNDIASTNATPAGRPLDYPTTHFDIALQPKLSTILFPSPSKSSSSSTTEKVNGDVIEKDNEEEAYVEKQLPNVLHGVHKMERGYLLEKEEARGRFGIVFRATVLRGEKRLVEQQQNGKEAQNNETNGIEQGRNRRDRGCSIGSEEDDWKEEGVDHMEQQHHQPKNHQQHPKQNQQQQKRRDIPRQKSNLEEYQVIWHATPQKAAVKVVQCHDLPTAMDAPQDGRHDTASDTTGYNHPLLEIAATRLVGGGYNYYETILGYHDCYDDEIGGHGKCHPHEVDDGRSNVTRLLDAYVDKTHLFMALPFYSGGELFHKVQKQGRFDEVEARYWFKQILQGLSTFHARGMCHLDLSLENVMIDYSDVVVVDDEMKKRGLGKAVIIDLGSSLRVPFHARPKECTSGGPEVTAAALASPTESLHEPSTILVDAEDDDEYYEDNTIQSINNTIDESAVYDVVNGGLRRLMAPLPITVGKIPYLPPELIPRQDRQPREPFDPFGVDLWASGIMLFLMLAGIEPWSQANVGADHRYRMAQSKDNGGGSGGIGALFQVKDITWLSEEVIDLLDRMLRDDPRERMSLGAVLEHPWVTKEDELC